MLPRSLGNIDPHTSAALVNEGKPDRTAA